MLCHLWQEYVMTTTTGGSKISSMCLGEKQITFHILRIPLSIQAFLHTLSALCLWALSVSRLSIRFQVYTLSAQPFSANCVCPPARHTFPSPGCSPSGGKPLLLCESSDVHHVFFDDHISLDDKADGLGHCCCLIALPLLTTPIAVRMSIIVSVLVFCLKYISLSREM